jgi:hypothetical protein
MRSIHLRPIEVAARIVPGNEKRCKPFFKFF